MISTFTFTSPSQQTGKKSRNCELMNIPPQWELCTYVHAAHCKTIQPTISHLLIFKNLNQSCHCSITKQVQFQTVNSFIHRNKLFVTPLCYFLLIFWHFFLLTSAIIIATGAAFLQNKFEKPIFEKMRYKHDIVLCMTIV